MAFANVCLPACLPSEVTSSRLSPLSAHLHRPSPAPPQWSLPCAAKGQGSLQVSTKAITLLPWCMAVNVQSAGKQGCCLGREKGEGNGELFMREAREERRSLPPRGGEEGFRPPPPTCHCQEAQPPLPHPLPCPAIPLPQMPCCQMPKSVPPSITPVGREAAGQVGISGSRWHGNSQ